MLFFLKSLMNTIHGNLVLFIVGRGSYYLVSIGRSIMGKLISVIVPVYNVAPYLREALDSLIYQTYKKLEIIIIDDGSTDGSGEICDEYLSDTRVKVIHQANKGLSVARNKGLDIMTGDYVSFLDSDDAFVPEMLEKMIEAMKYYDVDIVTCGYDTYRTDGKLNRQQTKKNGGFHFSEKKILDSKEAQNWVLFGKMPVNVWSKIYKKKIWKDIHFPEGHVYEDIQVIFQLFDKSKRILTIPDSYVLHRKRNESITETKSVKYTHDRLLALRKQRL